MTPEQALQINQSQREELADQQAEEWVFDSLTLREMCQRWGTQQVLHELEKVEPNLRWSIPSDAYLARAYDNPHPCGSFDEIF